MTHSEEQTMVTLTIGSAERELTGRSDIDESWINQQVNGRRADGQRVCVRVRIQGAVDLALASAGCGGTGGGGRPLTPDQQRVVDLWVERGLADSGFSGGNVVAFLRQLFNLLR
jgi:hypothetical protein